MGGVGTGGAGIDVQDETCSTGGPVTLPQFTSQDTVLRDKDARGHVSRGYLGVEKVEKVEKVKEGKVEKVEKVEKVKGKQRVCQSERQRTTENDGERWRTTETEKKSNEYTTST